MLEVQIPYLAKMQQKNHTKAQFIRFSRVEFSSSSSKLSEISRNAHTNSKVEHVAFMVYYNEVEWSNTSKIYAAWIPLMRGINWD